MTAFLVAFYVKKTISVQAQDKTSITKPHLTNSTYCKFTNRSYTRTQKVWHRPSNFCHEWLMAQFCVTLFLYYLSKILKSSCHRVPCIWNESLLHSIEKFRWAKIKRGNFSFIRKGRKIHERSLILIIFIIRFFEFIWLITLYIVSKLRNYLLSFEVLLLLGAKTTSANTSRGALDVAGVDH